MEHYDLLLTRVGELLEVGRTQARQQINTILVETYWHIGQHIVEFEQQGEQNRGQKIGVRSFIVHDK